MADSASVIGTAPPARWRHPLGVVLLPGPRDVDRRGPVALTPTLPSPPWETPMAEGLAMGPAASFSGRFGI